MAQDYISGRQIEKARSAGDATSTASSKLRGGRVPIIELQGDLLIPATYREMLEEFGFRDFDEEEREGWLGLSFKSLLYHKDFVALFSSKTTSQLFEEGSEEGTDEMEQDGESEDDPKEVEDFIMHQRKPAKKRKAGYKDEDQSGIIPDDYDVEAKDE